MNMDFINEKHGSVIVEKVNLTRATLKEAEAFKSFLYQSIEEGWQKIVVDLSECEFIDSTFLGALVVALKKVTAHGGDMKLVGFQPAVNSMFELTRMYRVFESYKSKEEAIQSYL
jgi:anti-anti-sigma factor